MRFKRSATILGTALVVGGFGTAASAAATLSQSVIPSNTPATTITVNFSGLNAADGNVYIQQCRVDGNAPGASFDPLNDCNQSTSSTSIGIPASGSGSKTISLFSGDEPVNAEWGCGPATSAGIPASATCYVRLAPGVKSNVSTDEFYAFTYGETPVVPEAPLNILLPLSALAVLGGGALIVNRKRQIRNVAA